MYEIYEKLLSAKDVTTADVCRATGLNESSIANWKKRGGYCSMETALKLSDYFSVPVDYIITGKDSKFSDQNAELVAKIRNDAKLSEALEIYFGLPGAKKALITDLINAMGDNHNV